VRDQVVWCCVCDVRRAGDAAGVGGAFGGKNNSYVDVVAALLARKAGRPVKVAMNRADTFLGTGPSSGTVIRLKLGAACDGRITAAQAALYYEVGAYPGSLAGSGANVMFGPYVFPHAQVDCYDVVVNKPPTASYRAPGGTPANFAMEALLDELAEKLGLDPLDFRLINSVRNGSEGLEGNIYQNMWRGGSAEAAKAHPHYTAPLAGPNGDAVWRTVMGELGRAFKLHHHGEPGRHGVASSPARWTSPARGRAWRCRPPRCWACRWSASSQAWATRTASATRRERGQPHDAGDGESRDPAAQDVIAKMSARAATLWEVPAESVTYQEGVFASRRMRRSASPLRNWRGSCPNTATPSSASPTWTWGSGARASPRTLWTWRWTRRRAK
jgi:hypothetical protein